MSQIAPAIDPNTTSRLLASLNFAIEEAKLVKLIISASDQKRSLIQRQTSADRVAYLSNEISDLEEKLHITRRKAKEVESMFLI